MIRMELYKPGIQIYNKIAKIIYRKSNMVDRAKHLYNVSVTAHGLIMIFYVLMPTFINGIGSLLIPRLIKSNDLAYPQAGSYSFLILLTSALFTATALFVKGSGSDRGPATGWTLYPPLSNSYYHSGKAVDFVVIAIVLACISSAITAANFIATIIIKKHNTLKLTELSLFVWAELISSILLIMAMPALISAISMLYTDRNCMTVFYEPRAGGDPLLFQHLFWFFGHPEVYILIFPSFGIVSEIISTFSNKPIFGKLGMVLAMLSIAIIGLVVWAHHMYTAGLSFRSIKYFTIATMFVSVPTGIKVFSWLGTMWEGSVDLKSPMLWALGFVVLFVSGGVTGIQLANASLNKVLHDTYYVVAHFHYILSVASIFAAMSCWYYWYHKIFKKRYNETLCIAHALLTFVAANLTFFPQYYLGLTGMPRRCIDYISSYRGWNKVSTYGSYLGLISVIMFMVVVIESQFKKEICNSNPWKS